MARGISNFVIVFVLIIVTILLGFVLTVQHAAAAQSVIIPYRLCEVWGPYMIEYDGANVVFQSGNYFVELPIGTAPPDYPVAAYLDGQLFGWVLYEDLYGSCNWVNMEAAPLWIDHRGNAPSFTVGWMNADADAITVWQVSSAMQIVTSTFAIGTPTGNIELPFAFCGNSITIHILLWKDGILVRSTNVNQTHFC